MELVASFPPLLYPRRERAHNMNYEDAQEVGRRVQNAAEARVRAGIGHHEGPVHRIVVVGGNKPADPEFEMRMAGVQKHWRDEIDMIKGEMQKMSFELQELCRQVQEKELLLQGAYESEELRKREIAQLNDQIVKLIDQNTQWQQMTTSAQQKAWEIQMEMNSIFRKKLQGAPTELLDDDRDCTMNQCEHRWVTMNGKKVCAKCELEEDRAIYV